MTPAVLTIDEQAEAESLLADLRSRGYTEQTRHGDLAPGVRVRHVGQQYPAAYRDGTGNVLAVLQRHEQDIEVLVAYDEPRLPGLSRLTVLANYHLEVIR